MLLPLCSTTNFSDFIFLGNGDTQSSQNITLFIVHSIFVDQSLSSTGVILNMPGRDGNFVLACTLAIDSLQLAQNVASAWQGQPGALLNDVPAHHKNGSCAKVCLGQRVHMGEHPLVQGLCRNRISLALVSENFLCYEPEIENCLQIN